MKIKIITLFTFISLLSLSGCQNEATSVGIIGGADGSTDIQVLDNEKADSQENEQKYTSKENNYEIEIPKNFSKKTEAGENILYMDDSQNYILVQETNLNSDFLPQTQEGMEELFGDPNLKITEYEYINENEVKYTADFTAEDEQMKMYTRIVKENEKYYMIEGSIIDQTGVSMDELEKAVDSFVYLK